MTAHKLRMAALAARPRRLLKHATDPAERDLAAAIEHLRHPHQPVRPHPDSRP
ncbi:hypothetical protein SAMN02800687_1996 [Curtobacterium sp. UNCCL20]|uniref:hypothetical protein n=1 Tax=Curtobacterium sp. UNCCL20 TaxID=1502773 RepID=UPI000882E7FF|nr:hypothetical protein [Curtobacterium sp. UNCCL20]SDQ58907.1 hypothetical protein SAMN02800687_1996 [Curtobacterium sp. UNCCL20]